MFAISMLVSSCIPPPCGTRWNQCGPRELMFTYDYLDTGYALQNQGMGWIDAVAVKRLSNLKNYCPPAYDVASPIPSTGFLGNYIGANENNLENVLSLFSELDVDKDEMITISEASSAYYHFVYNPCNLQ